ncbi:TPA: hypothetical protein ACK3Q6_004429 [Burkholderia cepacia]
MGKRLVLWLACALLFGQVYAAHADDGRAGRGGWHVRQSPRYMVSGVLRKNGSTDVIKPVQAIIDSDTKDAAVRQFEQSIERQYPGYALISTLAAPIPTTGTCENSI